MVSDDDYIGAGLDRLWQTPEDVVAVTGSNAYPQFSVSGADGTFTLDFASPDGNALVDRTYTGAERITGRDANTPGMDIFGDGRGCNTLTGSFTVHDVAADLARVWITYEMHCEGGHPALFGEIRIGEPAVTTATSIVPTRVAWPTDYPGVSQKPVPVHVVNRGPGDLTVHTPEIVAGGDDFSVIDNECLGPVAPGDSCTVYVGYTPSVAGTRLGELFLDTSAGTRWVPLAGGGQAGLTSWDMTSAPGDYIGGGKSYHFAPANDTVISASGTESSFQARVTSSTDDFSAVFRAGSGASLLTGATFPDATSNPLSTGAGISIDGDGRGDDDHGSFTVDKATYDVHGRLTSMLLDFTQYSGSSTAPLTGTISWRMPDPDAPAPDTTAPAPTTNLYAAMTAGGHTALSWNDPGDSDWVDTLVRYAPGRTAPATPDSGNPLYVGRDGETSATLPPILAGYSFTTFARDTSGNVSPAETFRLPAPEAISAHARPTPVIAGHRVTVAGRLLVAGTRIPFPHHPMRLRARRIGATTWHVIKRFRTAADGTFRVRLRLRHSTRLLVDDSFTDRVRASVSVTVRVVKG
jgi:hypothetical protein